MKEKFKIKKINKILIIFFLIISSFAYFHVAQASVATVIDDVFGWIFSLLTMIAGSMSAMIINGIVSIASYNGFIDQPQIVEAWKIIRDFCNMLFILILLVIAFASILRLENYSMKRWLPKVVIMAVLINFSRTIVGVLIDASQIVMLTFVNTFAGASGNFVGILQIDKFLKTMPGVNGLRTSDLLKGYAFAVIFLIVSIIVLLAVLVVFLMRVIFLWIYVALSPLAFLMMAFPGGQKYASQYWGNFTKYLLNGPVLAFFIWLALSTMQSGAVINGLSNNIISGGSTEILNADSFMSFILAIAFLVGGLMMSSQIGGMGAAWGSGMVSKAKNTGMNWGKRGVQRASGYDYASGVAKNYMASRKSVRDDKIRLSSEKLARGIGNFKQKFIAKPLSNKIGGGIKNKFGLNNNKIKAEELDDKVKTDRAELSETQEKIKNKTAFKHDGYDYKYEDRFGKWMKRKGGVLHGAKDNDQLIGKVESDYEAKIESKQKEADKFRKKQKTVDKALKYGLGAAGVGAGLATGGLGWVGLAAAGAGGVGLSQMGEKIRKAGQTDLKLASNVNAKQVNSEKDGMKMDSDEEVIAKMDDSTKSTYERTAATMEAVSRKLLDLNTVKRKREQMNNDFRGDKKIMGQMEALLEKNYVGASTTFRELDDPSKKDEAQRKITSRYENGIYTMKDMDNKSLQGSIKQLVLGLKTGKFISQYRDLSGSKQATISRTLKQEGSYEAREKLAHVTDINNAFGDEASVDKTKFTQSLSLNQLNEILTSNSTERIKALKDAIAKDSTNLSEQVRSAMLNDKNRIAQSIKGDLNIP